MFRQSVLKTLRKLLYTTSGAAPTKLSPGEISVNLTDKTLWVGNYSSSPVLVATKEPEQLNGYSDTVTEMRLTTDPGNTGSESLATTLAGEIERLRFRIKELADRLNGSSLSHWYTKLTGVLGVAHGGTGASNADAARANLSAMKKGTEAGPLTFGTSDATAVNVQTSNTTRLIVNTEDVRSSVKLMAKSGAGTSGNTNNCGFVFDGSSDTGLFSASSSLLSLFLSGTEVAFFDNASGQLQRALQLPHGRIKFPSSPNWSTDARVLDNFEDHGTWTPSWTRSVTNPTITYNSRSGRYIVIGSLLIAFFDMTIGVSAQGSGTWRLSGLPYPIQGLGGGMCFYEGDFVTATYIVTFSAVPSTTYAFMHVDTSSNAYTGSIAGSSLLGYVAYFIA